MIRRNNYGKEFKEKIGNGNFVRQSSVSRKLKGKGKSSNNPKLRNEIDTGKFEQNNQTEFALRKRVAELKHLPTLR
ncbi:MAG: hypothetical protein HS129_05940 [Leptospiraceae bacterium]|nr:hypothetical protein [Leptospiraceae bacterium]